MMIRILSTLFLGCITINAYGQTVTVESCNPKEMASNAVCINLLNNSQQKIIYHQEDKSYQLNAGETLYLMSTVAIGYDLFEKLKFSLESDKTFSLELRESRCYKFGQPSVAIFPETSGNAVPALKAHYYQKSACSKPQQDLFYQGLSIEFAQAE